MKNYNKPERLGSLLAKTKKIDIDQVQNRDAKLKKCYVLVKQTPVRTYLLLQ